MASLGHNTSLFSSSVRALGRRLKKNFVRGKSRSRGRTASVPVACVRPTSRRQQAQVLERYVLLCFGYNSCWAFIRPIYTHWPWCLLALRLSHSYPSTRKGRLWLPLLAWLPSIPAWISNHMPSKLWDEITYPFPNFNGSTVEVWEWMSSFIWRFAMYVITYPR